MYKRIINTVTAISVRRGKNYYCILLSSWNLR